MARASLTKAVKSVLGQETARTFQVIVVNDSGRTLPDADWHTDSRVRIIETDRVERSRARNAGAELAEGSYLLFLDDDDWLLPDALEQFSSVGEQMWMLGDCRMLSPTGALLTTLQFPWQGNCAVQAMAGEWLPLQSMCIRRQWFVKVGGFHDISLGEERELASRLALHLELYRIHMPLAEVVQNALTSTTRYTPEQTRIYWRERDALLDAPGMLPRLVASAQDAYWRGRLARLYLNGLLLNLQRGRVRGSVTRSGGLIRAIFVFDAVRHARSFWRGVTRSHMSSNY